MLSYIRRAGPNGDFISREISAHAMNIFMIKNFEWPYFTQYFTLGTITTVTIFLNLKTCFVSIWLNSRKRIDCYPTSGSVWMKRIWLNMPEVPMLMRSRFFSQRIWRKFWKKREFIKNDILLQQFMLCKNIVQYNNGLCNSSSDYRGVEIWIGKLMRSHINISVH